jgi:hypothetical protein
VLTAIALTPAAPVLIPELAGSARTEVAAIRDGALRAARVLPDRWIAVGVADTDATLDSDVRGTFAGYGADVRVQLGPDASGTIRRLPLCALFAGWLRGEVDPHASVRVHAIAAATPAAIALERGRAWGAEIRAAGEPIGVLIVADGAATLTETAPGGYDAAAQAVQQRLDDALGSADVSALREARPEITGGAAYQVLAGIAGDTDWTAAEFARGAPYGVGYFAGAWTPA